MKRLLIITLADGTIKEIDLLTRGQLPIGLKQNSQLIQKLCEDFATQGFYDEPEGQYIAPGFIRTVKPQFTDLEILSTVKTLDQ